MEVYPIDCPRYLIETYVVEPFETSSTNLTYSMIRHQELLFPAHEHVFAIRTILVMKIGLLRKFCKRPPGWKAGPVSHVLLIACTPVIMSSLEGVLGSDNLAFKKCCQSCVLWSEACIIQLWRSQRTFDHSTFYLKIAADE